MKYAPPILRDRTVIKKKRVVINSCLRMPSDIISRKTNNQSNGTQQFFEIIMFALTLANNAGHALVVFAQSIKTAYFACV